jgi:hypothetical protein
VGLWISRPLNYLIQVGLFSALLVGAPLSLAQMARRHGWSAGRPAAANLVGVLPLGVGMGLLPDSEDRTRRAIDAAWTTDGLQTDRDHG